MIISALHRFVFAAVPKTGTHSVRQALREHMGPDDLEQVRLFLEKRFPIPELARLGHGHVTLQQVRPFMSKADFEGFFKFAFVRNPFDRFVSFCAFMTRGTNMFERDAKGVMRHILFTVRPVDQIVFQPQHIFVTDEQGALLSDYIGRVEQMQQSYDEICRRIGIAATPLEKINASQRGDYRQYYDQQLIDGVSELYARDLELFGYDF
jgi:Sulfotransferase family